MKKVIFFIFLLGGIASGSAQPIFQIKKIAEEAAVSVQLTSTNKLIIGYNDSATSNAVLLDWNANVRNHYRYPLRGVRGVAQAPDEGILMMIDSVKTGGSHHTACIYRFDKNFKQQWRKDYFVWEWGTYASQVCASDSFLYASYVHDGHTAQNPLVIHKLSYEGKELSQYRAGLGGDSFDNTWMMTKDQGIFAMSVSGYSQGSKIMKYTKDMKAQWYREISGPEKDSLYVTSFGICETRDSAFVIAGNRNYTYPFLLKLDAKGDTVSLITDFPKKMKFFSLAQNKAGNYYLYAYDTEKVLLKLAESGTTIWRKPLKEYGDVDVVHMLFDEHDQLLMIANKDVKIDSITTKRYAYWIKDTTQAIVNVSGQQAKSFNMEVFPNPTKGELQLHCQFPTATLLQLQLYDMLGRKVQEESLFLESGAAERLLSISNLPKGQYILRAESPQYGLQSKPIVIY